MAIYGNLIRESQNISSFKVINNPSKEFIEKHVKDANCIKDFLQDSIRKNSCMFLDPKNNKIVCVFMVFNDRGHYILNNFEITPDYRGKKLSEQFLDYAVKKKKADHLWVNENNKIAIHLYLKYGFSFTGDKMEEDGHTRLYMELKKGK